MCERPVCDNNSVHNNSGPSATTTAAFGRRWILTALAVMNRPGST